MNGLKPKGILYEHIAGWIDLIQPQVVLTSGPDGVTGRPDHTTLSRVVTQVVDQYFPQVCLLYLTASKATQLGCGASTVPAGDEPVVACDISPYKTQKVRAIQCHASQQPPLTGKPEGEADKLACQEVFRVARCPEKDGSWFDLSDCTVSPPG